MPGKPLFLVLWYTAWLGVASFAPFRELPYRNFAVNVTGRDQRPSGELQLFVKDRTVVVADFYAGLIRLLSLDDGEALGLLEVPGMNSWTYGAAMLNDGTVAVGGMAEGRDVIFVVDVSGDVPVILRSFQTAALLDHGVIGNGPDNNILSISYQPLSKDCRIDVISADGNITDTLTDHLTVALPMYATRHNDELYISDWFGLAVFNTKIRETKDTLGELPLSDLSNMSFSQAAFDQIGNMFVGAIGEMCEENTDGIGDRPCVLVVSPEGRWRKLVDGPVQSEPKGLAVTSSGFVITWYMLIDDQPLYRSLLEVYDFF